MWDLWWTKWHWDRFFYKFFSFPLSVSSHHGSPYSYISEMNNRTVGGRKLRDATATDSHATDMNNKLI
jgi:hypothetical protein